MKTYIMDPILSSILFGVLGGFVRALVGIAKYFEKNKQEQKIRLWYLVFTLLVAAIMGGLAGVLANGDWRLAVIAGYAGTDFLEGLYKIKKKQGFEIWCPNPSTLAGGGMIVVKYICRRGLWKTKKSAT